MLLTSSIRLSIRRCNESTLTYRRGALHSRERPCGLALPFGAWATTRNHIDELANRRDLRMEVTDNMIFIPTVNGS